MSLLEESIEAHGGREAFERLDTIGLRLRCRGPALGMKLRPAVLTDRATTVELHEPRVSFQGLGTWTGHEPRPRAMPWRLRWTDRDVVHFAGYALWNYLAAPFIWTRCESRELSGRRIALRFPPEIPTHSPEQVAHFDGEGRIVSLDYTAEVFGRWARARNVCLAYERVAGVLVPVERRVTPRGLRPAPALLTIRLRDVRPMK